MAVLSPVSGGADGRLSGLSLLFTGAVILILLNYIGTALYNVFLHPLAPVPGPKFRAASRLPRFIGYTTGTDAQAVLALHDKYGPVVRLAPNVVSFISGEARIQIYGYKLGGKPHFIKDPVHYVTPPNGFHNLHSVSNDVEHARQRRLLAHSFSERSLREQEPLLRSYVDLLVQRLYEQVSGPAEGNVDMVKFLNFTSFDLIGDLTFGEPFDCLKNSDYHPWIALVFKYMRGAVFLASMTHYPFMNRIFQAFIGKRVSDARMDHFKLSQAKMDKRLATKTDRPDFVHYLQRVNDNGQMPLGELHSNSELLILAGSETTATALSGALYGLCMNREAMRRVVQEVREAMRTKEEITIGNVLQLKYMAAVLDEAMRFYPPVPGDMPRLSPGDTVDGYYIPPGTIATIGGYAQARSSYNFKDPEKFIPERWIEGEKGIYKNDKTSASHPFSYGPRNCIGKNLAYAEMRLILSKLLWNFDIELLPESHGWEHQKSFMLWEKPELRCRLNVAKH